MPHATTRILSGATIYPSPNDTIIRDGVVIIEGATIVAVGARDLRKKYADAQIIDCTGCTITAGFRNSHVHFFERKWADAAAIPAEELARQLEDSFTQYGFTDVFDTGSAWENTRAIRDRIESGEVRGPRIRSTGPGLLPPGALPSETVLAMMGVTNFPAPEIASDEDAEAAAHQLLAAGVDGIKLFASSPRSEPLRQSAIAAAAVLAHAAGKPVYVHPNTGADVLTALRAGADVIAHTTPHSGPWDDTLLDEVRRRTPALTPTLSLWKFFSRHDRRSSQDKIVETACVQLRAWIDAGGRVLFGTDLGAVDPDPREEYALMAHSGMSYSAILDCLTTATLAPGSPADLTVVDGDPTLDVRASASVRYTLRGGKIIYDANANR